MFPMCLLDCPTFLSDLYTNFFDFFLFYVMEECTQTCLTSLHSLCLSPRSESCYSVLVFVCYLSCFSFFVFHLKSCLWVFRFNFSFFDILGLTIDD